MKQTKKNCFLNVWYLTSIPTNVFLLSESTITPSLYIPSPLTMWICGISAFRLQRSETAGGSRGTLDWIVIGRIEMTSSRRAKRIQKVFFAALIYLRNYKAEHSQQENLHLLIWLRMPQKSSPATRGMVICFLRRRILCLYIF